MASPRRRKAGEQAGNDPNAWMVTFGDLIMLLLTFFVMLLTMKSMDDKNVKEILREVSLFRGPLEFVDKGKEGIQALSPDLEERKQWIEDGQMVLRILEGNQSLPVQKEQFEKAGRLLDVSEDGRGVVITLQADELFDSGSADIRADRLGVLESLGHLLRKAANDIIIIGHTDDIPIQSPSFPSNWELSLGRANAVHDFFVKHAGLEAGQIAPGGFGDAMPRYANTDPGNRAKNRRVEFILKARD